MRKEIAILNAAAPLSAQVAHHRPRDSSSPAEPLSAAPTAALATVITEPVSENNWVKGAKVMSAKHRCKRNSSQKASDPVNPVMPANVGRSRPALLASASLVALAALNASGVARAACVPSPQIIATPVSGPIDSNGGAITVTGTGSITGGPGGDGVDALTCAITTLTNQSGGTISGGNGASGTVGGAGGVGVSNANTITTLNNSGAISGGNGGSGTGSDGRGGAGGAGGRACRPPGRSRR